MEGMIGIGSESKESEYNANNTANSKGSNILYENNTKVNKNSEKFSLINIKVNFFGDA